MASKAPNPGPGKSGRPPNPGIGKPGKAPHPLPIPKKKGGK